MNIRPAGAGSPSGKVEKGTDLVSDPFPSHFRNKNGTDLLSDPFPKLSLVPWRAVPTLQCSPIESGSSLPASPNIPRTIAGPATTPESDSAIVPGWTQIHAFLPTPQLWSNDNSAIASSSRVASRSNSLSFFAQQFSATSSRVPTHSSTKSSGAPVSEYYIALLEGRRARKQRAKLTGRFTGRALLPES